MLLSVEIFRHKEMLGRNLLSSSYLSLTDQFLSYLDKEWQIYDFFLVKMLCSKEELGEKDLHTHFQNCWVVQVSPPCEGIWDNFEIDHEIIPYFEEESTFEEIEYLGEGRSPRNESNDEHV